MRTKALLGLAALAAMITSAAAQNVYSVNVVGYVNVTLQANKLHFLSLPLASMNGDYNIRSTIDLATDAQENAILYDWAGTQWNPDPAYWYGGGLGWYNGGGTDVIVSNGVAFFLSSVADSVLTFVGEVPQGTIDYNVPTGNSTLANKVPAVENFPGSTDVGNENDIMFTWVQAAQTWTDDPWYNYGVGTGWYTGTGGDGTGPLLNPSEGVFYINSGAAVPFSRSFTVPQTP